jgi:Tfp pilus assembly PilM family ATPase
MKSASEIINELNEQMSDRLIEEIKRKIQIYMKMNESEIVKRLQVELEALKEKLPSTPTDDLPLFKQK